MSTAADRDEQAELRMLRDATAQSAAQAGQTLGALVGRAHATTGRTRAIVGKAAASASRVRATARRVRRPVLLAGLPATVLLTAGLLARRRFTARPRPGR